MENSNDIGIKSKKIKTKYDRYYDLLEIKTTHVYKKHDGAYEKLDILKNKNIHKKESKISYMIMAHKIDDQLNLLLESLLSDHRSVVYVHLDAKVDIHNGNLINQSNRIVFLENRVRVNWGGFSAVQAMKNLIYEALKDVDSDRFVFISGSCFPIKIPVKINNNLLRSKGNIFSIWGGIDPENLSSEGLGRYCVTKFQPCDIESLNPKKSILHSRVWNFYKKVCGKFPLEREVVLSDLWRGSQFFAANRAVAEWFAQSHPDLDHALKWSLAPDEIYFNTLYIRYIRQQGEKFSEISPCKTEQGTHYIKKTAPQNRTLRQKLFDPIDLRKLNEIDLPEALASSCFFARKCNPEISKEIKLSWNG
ncbi:beta-1,6-N-acetylglucosaminyltransferase [Acetobacter sp.]|jgi:hypothetical protein|uniref:beta-1,6-N-acetylglucosaminyltransferase n=1 Tax=Acetobacter sp. TaxID=440 RepID=UPI0025C076CF|nr:beta-1,6-N-acetylglucosaminyltransferase [Acetobacter sp.]MCH4091406.1 beta-1,6-N-acetylglucosaminyltransferase [Acetobacter sp.]MCI1299384.1 beta-1,6-N-acetylglucosaminyltransferase [Acetobacter sp.]MCI1316612.1 beta-1,6-N-acetylglucosaminyltransferase [Acetobacter sp.]